MLIVAGRVAVKPERRADAIRMALDVASATREEAGCISYRFYADLEDPNVFLIFEEWQDAAALSRHFEMPHMTTFMQEMPSLVAGGADFKRYDVAGVEPM